MNTKITFFPVDNGDMTLVQLADREETTLLIDCKIRQAADDPDDVAPDVAKALREKLGTDSQGRPYVDAMLLSHPDEDHCLGLRKHFWLGPLEEYADDHKAQTEKRIVIREMWSSPMVFRRASASHPLCEDAKAFNKEAKRRVREFLRGSGSLEQGDKILILGEDENGKTDALGPILVRRGESIEGVNGKALGHLTGELLGPFSKSDAEEEALASKNNSSVIIRFALRNVSGSCFPGYFLAGGDAGVHIWENVWATYPAGELEYHLLLAPHHCSWRTLSHDSWSDKREQAVVSEEALKALSQARRGAVIVSSSKPISEDDSDPPCIRAKREYKRIVDRVDGTFKCTGESPSKNYPMPLTLEWGGASFVAAATTSKPTGAPPRAGR